MVWYCKYQFRYIIGLWSQKWKKNVCFLTLATFILWKIILLEGDVAQLGASWLCPTNYRGEPHEILVNVLKTSSTLHLYAEKKGKFRTVFQNILFIGQFKNCFIYVFFAARGKSKIETTGLSVKRIPIFFNKELVSSFFLVNLSGGQFFVTAENRHLWNVSETLKEFTLPITFSSFSF